MKKFFIVLLALWLAPHALVGMKMQSEAKAASRAAAWQQVEQKKTAEEALSFSANYIVQPNECKFMVDQINFDLEQVNQLGHNLQPSFGTFKPLTWHQVECFAASRG